jgi:hypothetical protein
LCLTVLKATPTIAAIVSYDFTVDIDSDPFQGNQYNGFFRYLDEPIPSNLTGRLFDIITEFEFSFINSAGLPTTYSADDVFFTSIYFSNGLFDGLDIEAQVNNVLFTFDSVPIVLEEFSYTILPLPTDQFGSGSVTYNRREEPATSVREPASLAGLLAFGALAVGSTLKHKFQAKNLG